MEANADKDYAGQCLKRRKKNPVKFRYQNPKHVLEGSNIAERFFSDVKYFLSRYRKSTFPVHMEESLMLRYNARYWDRATVAAVVGKGADLINATEVAEDEEN